MNELQQLEACSRLLSFLRCELDEEERWGFPRLGRVPDSYVQDRLKHYRLLPAGERDLFKDCSAHLAYRGTAGLVNAPDIEHTAHPYWHQWSAIKKTLLDDPNLRNVPMLRAIVQQYKMDKYRNRPSSISEAQFAYASSIRPVTLPERRRRVRTVLKRFGLFKVDDLGYYHCSQGGQPFDVHVDFGGNYAQLRYGIVLHDLREKVPHHQGLAFESVLGFGFGHWNYIVEENVDDIFDLFAEVVAYVVELPTRIRRAVL